MGRLPSLPTLVLTDLEGCLQPISQHAMVLIWDTAPQDRDGGVGELWGLQNPIVAISILNTLDKFYKPEKSMLVEGSDRTHFQGVKHASVE